MEAHSYDARDACRRAGMCDGYLELCQGVRVGSQLQRVEGASWVQPVQAVKAGARALRAVRLCATHENDLRPGSIPSYALQAIPQHV